MQCLGNNERLETLPRDGDVREAEGGSCRAWDCLFSTQSTSERAFRPTIPAHTTRGRSRIDSPALTHLQVPHPAPSLLMPLLGKESLGTLSRITRPKEWGRKDSGPPLRSQGYLCWTLGKSFHPGELNIHLRITVPVRIK